MARNEKLQSIINKIPPTMTALELEKHIDLIKERDATLVTGTFRHLENKGGYIKFWFNAIGDKMPKRYIMVDNIEYRIPFGVAVHINTGCNTIEYAHVSDAAGKKGGIKAGYNDGRLNTPDSMYVQTKVPRFAFISADVPNQPMHIIQATPALNQANHAVQVNRGTSGIAGF
jgi:hypothetical protein